MLRPVIAEIVQQQKWVELRHLAVPEHPLEMHAGPFERGLAFKTLRIFRVVVMVVLPGIWVGNRWLADPDLDGLIRLVGGVEPALMSSI